MDAIAILTAFGEDVEDFIIAKAISNCLREKEQLYTPHSFDIMSIPATNFQFLFRFDRPDILDLFRVLQLPNKFVTTDMHVIDGIAGLCLLLRRFVYPNRLKDLQNLFGLHFSSLSKLLFTITTFVYDKWGCKLQNMNENSWFTTDLQKEMAALVQRMGSPLHNCISFIDGTAHAICRPSRNQREVYSGHKRNHCIKFQNITLPNGIILHLSLPFPGRRHDAFILRDTNILHQMDIFAPGFVLYGDEGYPLRRQLIRPYSNSRLTNEQVEFNKRMSSLRQCVEWSFGKIAQQFAFVDFEKNQKLYLQPVGMYYIVAALLTNAHTCVYGSTTSTYFNIESTDLEEYFRIGTLL